MPTSLLLGHGKATSIGSLFYLEKLCPIVERCCNLGRGALNDWAHESGQTLKAKITEEVESAVRKMGFVKREEFDALAKEVAALTSAKKSSPKKRTAATVKKAPAKAKPRKKATASKAVNARGAKR